MLEKNINQSKEEVKRRKSAQINNFPQINYFVNNLNTSYKSTSDLGSAQPIFKSNSLFAYQELDQFSSFCDDGSFPSEILSEKNKNNQANNANLNNSTKLEDEQSDSCDESFDNNNDISEDDIFLKKNKQKKDKRKSAFYMIPSYLRNLSSFNKPNEPMSNNNLCNSDKKVDINDINNNFINSNSKNFMINSSNCPYNMRRGSNPVNQFRKDMLFNNILFNNNQNKYIFLPNLIEPNNNNLTNIINNTNQNIPNNINNNTINFIQNIQNPNPSNFQNYNFMPNFPYNNYFNNNNNTNNNNNIINNQNIHNKKRNSQKIKNQPLIHQSQVSTNRRGSHPSASNYQILSIEKQTEKNKNIIKEENPSYFLQDQLYCRQIQSKLEKNVKNPKYCEDFYETIKPRLIEIIEHQFGNYVMQKFLEVLLSQRYYYLGVICWHSHLL